MSFSITSVAYSINKPHLVLTMISNTYYIHWFVIDIEGEKSRGDED